MTSIVSATWPSSVSVPVGSSAGYEVPVPRWSQVATTKDSSSASRWLRIGAALRTTGSAGEEQQDGVVRRGSPDHQPELLAVDVDGGELGDAAGDLVAVRVDGWAPVAAGRATNATSTSNAVPVRTAPPVRT